MMLLAKKILNNLLEKGHYPCFVSTIRPSDGSSEGTYIDNIYIKSKSLNFKTFVLTVSFTDHYPIIDSNN